MCRCYFITFTNIIIVTTDILSEIFVTAAVTLPVTAAVTLPVTAVVYSQLFPYHLYSV